MEFKIGNIKPHNKIVMAPMAGISNQAYRTICKEMGAGLIYAEMVSDKGIAYQNVKTKKMCEVAESEHPIAMQIFGSDYKTITASAKEMVKLSNFDILDVNMGCPVNKVIKNDSGSALLKYPDKIYDIVKSLKENVDLPVTIKIRAGYDFSSINCDEVARIACKAGVDAITIHGRTRSQLYTGKANLDYIKMVKDVSTVPVIGNGDIKDIESAIDMANEIAPEHLELCLDNAYTYLDKIKNAGSVFLGRYCPEALGDYMAGLNHTLPTSGTARFSSPLSVDDFIKKTQYVYYTEENLKDLYLDVDYFAKKEGLSAHAKSATIRFSEDE